MSPSREKQFFQWLYDYLNRQLFQKKLPKAQIAFGLESRKTGVYFSTRPEHRKQYYLSINCHKFYNNPPMLMVSMLVNQMVHIWLKETGRFSRPGYCNRHWAAKMEEIGLIPSQNGKPGGKKTGQFVIHYIQAGGAFELAYNLMDDKVLEYLNQFVKQINLPNPKDQNRNKIKYSCPKCSISSWGKPGLHLICGKCRLKLQ